MNDKTMKEVIYETKGTCSRAIRILLDDEQRVQEVQFIGGCQGNTSGIAALVRGMKAEDVVARLHGIQCGMKGTSCPDQLSRALEAEL